MNKMHHILIFILTLICTINSYSQITFSNDEQKILANIAQEMKMIKSIRNSNLSMEYRLFELYVEKNRIIFTAENRNYIKHGDPTKNKLSYFPQSFKNYKYIHKFGLLITIKSPLFYGNSNIFYTLAQIAKDFEGDKYTKLYLRKALEQAKDKELKYKIIKGLAEYYFNHKKFKAAAHYFRRAIQYNTPWNTKHFYNLAWCYEMRKNYNKALNILLQSYELSNKKGFVNITPQILKSSTVFFIRAKKIEQAITFYKQNVPDTAATYILKLARRTKKKGNWPKTKLLITELRKLNPTFKDSSFFQELLTFQFETYKDFQKNDLFIQLAKECQQWAKQNKNIHFSDKTILLIEQKNEYLQQIIVAKKQFNGQINKQTAKHITTFYDILKDINPERKCVYEYHQGEHFFFTQHYKQAVNNYHHNLTLCQQSKNREYLLKSINSLLGTINYIQRQPLPARQQLKLDAFNCYITNWKKSPKAQLYLEDIFKIYSQQQDITYMNSTFQRYRRRYHKEYKKLKTMLTQIADYYIKRQDDRNISRIITAINKLRIPFSKEEINRFTTALATIIFAKLNSNPTDQKSATLKKIFNSNLYPQKIKMESALKLVLLHAKQQNFLNLIKWQHTFFTVATTKQKQQMRKYFFPLLSNLYLQGNFKETIQLADLFAQECKIFAPQQQTLIVQISKDIILQTTSSSILPLQLKHLIHSDQCYISKPQFKTIQIDLYNFHLLKKDIRTALIWANKIDPQIISELYNQKIEHIWEQAIFGISPHNLQQLQLFSQYLRKDAVKPIREVLNTYHSLQGEIINFQNLHLNIPTPFDEGLFNQSLENFLALTTEQAAKIEITLPKLPAKLAIKSLIDMQIAYQQHFKRLRNVRFPGLDKHYKKSLQQVLKKISTVFYRKGRNLAHIEKKTVTRSKLYNLAKAIKQKYDLTPLELMDQTMIYLSYDQLLDGGER